MLAKGFTAGYVETKTGLVHYVERDTLDSSSEGKSSNKTIVMLHQGGSSGREFKNVAIALDGWRVLMPDIPGHGNSSVCESASIAEYAQGIKEFLEELKITETVLFGHHFGGVVAVETAVLAGDTVSDLILSNTPYVDEYARGLRKGEKPRSYIATEKDGSHLIKLWQTRMDLFKGDALLANRYIAENLLLGPDVEKAHLAVATYLMEDRFHLYKGDTTYIHGVADPYIAIEIDHALQRFNPIRTVTLEEGTVALVDQSPNEVAAVIKETKNE